MTRNTRIRLNASLIKRERLKLGLSQSQWADQLGISQKLASKIETNKGISNETLDKVAAKLRLHPEDLLDDGICPYCGHERKE